MTHGSQNVENDGFFDKRQDTRQVDVYTMQGVDVEQVTVLVPMPQQNLEIVSIQQVPWMFAAPQGNAVPPIALGRSADGKHDLTLVARVINFRVVTSANKDPSSAADHEKVMQTSPQDSDSTHLAVVYFSDAITLEVSYSDALARAAGGAEKLKLVCDDPKTHAWRIFGEDEVFGEKHGFRIDEARKCGIVTCITRWIDPHVAWAHAT